MASHPDRPRWWQAVPPIELIEATLYDHPDLTEAAAQHYGRTVRAQRGGWKAACACGEWVSFRRDHRDHTEYDHARHIAAAVLAALAPASDPLTVFDIRADADPQPPDRRLT